MRPDIPVGLTVSVAEGREARALCLAVRREVFIDEQGVSAPEEVDGLDDACIHLLAMQGDAVIGAARIRPLDGIAKIQRVCVRKDRRGTGAGAAIMRFAIDFARRDGRFGTVVLGAQTHALDFYRKFGFTEYGEEYLDAGIPHRDMTLSL